MSHNIDYLNRVPANFISSKVEEVLPEHFTTEYPNLVAFLKEYYNYLEADDRGFTYLLGTLYQARDMNTTLLSQLDNLFSEIGLGLKSSDFDINPRLIAKLFANFYREKGSANSAKLFFRAFYDEEIQIDYPKRNMFIVNESQLGPDSLRYIQNDERYQIHSILIKSGISISKWQELFKKFVHPAGFYLSGDVFIESVGNLNIGAMPISIPIDPNSIGKIIIEGAAIAQTTAYSEIWSDRGYVETIDVERTLKDVEFVTGTQFDNQYTTFLQFADTDKPTFDTETKPGVDFSNNVETMDGDTLDPA
jgi:hypothetical protein